jgi:hypothetical protein
MEARVAIRDLEYDVLTVLQSKLEAAVVYDRYIEDAEQAKDAECRRLFEEIKREDGRRAERHRTELGRLLGRAT